MEMPTELVINGTLYVRAEGRHTDLLTVAQIHEMTAKSVHAINDAMNAGLLPYSVPAGCKRPRRARRADVLAWMEGRAARAGE